MNLPRSFQTAALAIFVVGILLLALGGYLTPLSQIAFSPFISAQTWLSSRYLAIRDFMTAPRDVARLTQINEQLEAEISRLQSQIIELQQQNSELQVLSALLDFARTHAENEYITAAVIGRDISPFMHYVIINRGSDDGLRRGMPVVSSQGLVGRVAAVTADGARVQLISDPGTAINVRIQPSGTEGLLQGSITGDITVEAIAQDASIQNGDLVLTSGLGGNYPPDMLIGQVSGVRQRPVELFQTATVEPVVDFASLEIVLVIVNFQPVNIAPLIPSPGGE
ncbi:MAG: rod shape-determining protein MreC [Chloroflexota bacterium]|nr:MAG: rod shape-determining protein MreC [Chloroflexota bacterium]